MRSQPMDGQHQRVRPGPRNSWPRLNRNAYHALGIASCLGLTFLSSAAFSADRPGLLQRALSRPKNATTTDAPQVDATSESRAKQKPQGNLRQASAEADASTSKESQATYVAKNLDRFPAKPATSGEKYQSSPQTILSDHDVVTPIDLPMVLQLAGIQSPEVLLAQQRVLATTARQQLAAAQALPNLNLGGNYDQHTGALQRSTTGNLIDVQRSSLYVGAGANAIGSSTVNLPGLQYNLNVGEAYFNYLVSQQQTERFRAGAAATQNNMLLQVTKAYCQLVREEGARAIAINARDSAAEIARITSSYVKVGLGLPADAERAATEVGRRDADILAADNAVIEASARLGRLLYLQSSIRLHANENWVVPRSIVPEPIPLPELIAISLYRRPEVAQRRAEIHGAMLELEKAQLLIFSPQFIAGFSDGAFGGGSNLSTQNTGAPRFGDFGNRTDQDIIFYWSIRNLGLGNRALIKVSTARLAATDWEQTQQLNDVRTQVATAYARTQTRVAQLDVRERAIKSSQDGFDEDMRRAKAGEGRPIEVLDSLRLVARAQLDYLDTISDYNQAQYELYVAIGQPPADLLIHTNPPQIPPEPK